MPPTNLEKRRVSGIASLFYWSRLKISGSPRADLDAHSDFQTDQVPHTTIHMFGRLKRRSLCFLLLIPAAVAQGPWRVIYTKAKREISHVRNMVRLLLRWIAETESTSKNGITERLHRRVEGRT